MVGEDTSLQTIGVIPCAISWLFRLINDQKQKSGAKFSVRVSSVELYGKDEHVKDLLADQDTGGQLKFKFWKSLNSDWLKFDHA